MVPLGKPLQETRALLVQYPLGISYLGWGWGQPFEDVGCPGGDSCSSGTAQGLFHRLDLSVLGPRDTAWAKGKVLLHLVNHKIVE